MHRYMLTEEGKEVARDCLLRSGLVDPCENAEPSKEFPFKDQGQTLDSVSPKEGVSVVFQPEAAKVAALTPSHLASMEKQNDISPEYLDRVCFLYLAYLKHLVRKFRISYSVLTIFIFYSMLNVFVLYKSKFMSQC